MPRTSVLYRFATTASTIGFAQTLLITGISYNLDLDARSVTIYGAGEIDADIRKFAENWGGVDPNANLAPFPGPRTYQFEISESERTMLRFAMGQCKLTDFNDDAKPAHDLYARLGAL